MTKLIIYITTKDKDQAKQIGKILVEERLAACVNIIDEMASIYWWNNSLNEDNEAILIAKTTQDLLDPLTARVKQLHTYECPCIVAIPIIGGNPDYLQWIEQQTSNN